MAFYTSVLLKVYSVSDKITLEWSAHFGYLLSVCALARHPWSFVGSGHSFPQRPLQGLNLPCIQKHAVTFFAGQNRPGGEQVFALHISFVETSIPGHSLHLLFVGGIYWAFRTEIKNMMIKLLISFVLFSQWSLFKNGKAQITAYCKKDHDDWIYTSEEHFSSSILNWLLKKMTTDWSSMEFNWY